MSVTVMRMYYAKQKPSIFHYGKFKNFCNDSFVKDTGLLLPKLCDQQNFPFKTLKESVKITFDKYEPLKDTLELISPLLWIKNWPKKLWKGHVWESSF